MLKSSASTRTASENPWETFQGRIDFLVEEIKVVSPRDDLFKYPIPQFASS